MKQKIVSNKAPAAVGPYSQGIKVGDMLFCAGQIGLDPKTNLLIEGRITTQTKQALENLKAVLAEAGMTLKNVVKTNVYLTNMADFAVMNEIYGTYFADPYPARATVAVAALPKGAIVEIECIAYLQREET